MTTPRSPYTSMKSRGAVTVVTNNEGTAKKLAMVYIFKIAATVVFWALPLMVLPADLLLQLLGLPSFGNNYQNQNYLTIMFLRMLAWAYLALCVSYWFGLQAAWQRQEILVAPVVVGLVSNGGACLWLVYFGLRGDWNECHVFVQFVLWSSVVATAIVTAGLYWFGYRAFASSLQ